MIALPEPLLGGFRSTSGKNTDSTQCTYLQRLQCCRVSTWPRTWAGKEEQEQQLQGHCAAGGGVQPYQRATYFCCSESADLAIMNGD